MMKKSLNIYYVLILVITLGAGALVVLNGSKNNIHYKPYIELLNEQMMLEAALSKEILMVANGARWSYTNLNKVHSTVRNGLDTLYLDAQKNAYWEHAKFEELFKKYNIAENKRTQHIEKFKSELSILRNSDLYSKKLLLELGVESNNENISAENRNVYFAIYNIYAKQLLNDSVDVNVDVKKLNTHIESLGQKQSRAFDVIGKLGLHVDLVRMAKSKSTESLDAIIQSEIPSLTESIFHELVMLDGNSHYYAHRLNSLLMILSVSLAIGVGILLYKTGKIAAMKTAMGDLETRVDERTEELRITKEIAVAADNTKSVFLANMSHEIRTPMNGVIGMAELLTLTQLTEKQKLYASTIKNSGLNLLTIINDILDFSKIEAGKLELDVEPFDMVEAVEDIATLLGVTARNKAIELIVRIQPNLPQYILGDANRFRQVLTNIIGNAIKFTSKGHVLIDISGKEGDLKTELSIKIQDTGIGIVQDKLETIFDAFTQAENSTTRNYGGTGLGLSITRDIVKLMGGHIIAESIYGKGSSFTIELTMDNVPQSERKTALKSDLSAFKILVIDDNEITRKVLKEQLSIRGADVHVVATGEDALGVVQNAHSMNDQFDMVLLDYQMPIMNGVAVLKSLQESLGQNHPPITVLSSIDEVSTSEAFSQFNIAEQLSKPVRVAVLEKVILQILLDQSIEGLAEIMPGGEVCTNKASSPENSKIPRLLIAEDNNINQLVIEHMIDTELYDIIFVENGSVAYNTYRKDEFDLILMDISMPVMDGIDATKAIRKYEQANDLPPTPIIALTAHALNTDRDNFLSIGMDDYIAKPINLLKLTKILEKWLVKATRDGNAIRDEAV